MRKSAMRIVLGGVRGSTPLSHPRFMRFGGSTSCVLIEDGAGARIVVDGGTGLRTLTPRLVSCDSAVPVLMLFTHYHLDHLIGLPSFAPLYNPDWHIVLAAPPREGVTAEMALARLTAKPFWPAPFRARLDFLVLPEPCGETLLRHGPFDVRWCAVRHRDGCHAYRIDERDTGASLVLATDLDWAASDAGERAALIRLCSEPRPADVLIMEGYDPSSPFVGWGHSAWPASVQIARAAGARRLVITHHSSDDDDRALAQREQEIRSHFPAACVGYDGMVIPWGREDTC